MKITETVNLELRYKTGMQDDYGKSFLFTKQTFNEMIEFVKLKKKYDIRDRELVVWKSSITEFDPNEKTEPTRKQNKKGKQRVS